jgi:hypothetical protein
MKTCCVTVVSSPLLVMMIACLVMLLAGVSGTRPLNPDLQHEAHSAVNELQVYDGGFIKSAKSMLLEAALPNGGLAQPALRQLKQDAGPSTNASITPSVEDVEYDGEDEIGDQEEGDDEDSGGENEIPTQGNTVGRRRSLLGLSVL